MNVDIALLILFISAILIFIIIWTIFSQKKRAAQPDPYLEALEYLADGDDHSAMEKFKEAIRQNSNNIGAYLRLGDRLREQGFTKNALRIHKELTLRENLTKEDELRINKSLLFDYEKNKDFENGISIAKRISQEDKSSEKWIIKQLIEFYEKAEKWNDAIEIIRKNFKPFGSDHKHKISLYLVFQGLHLHTINKAREGRIKFKEALKLDPSCSAAYFYLGKSYQNESRIEDAIREWQNFCRKIPKKAHIVFPYLEKAYFDKGIFEDIESFYEELIDLDEKNINTVLALVAFYVKKGKYDKAHILLEKAKEDFADSPQLAAKKIQVLFHINQHKEAAKEALQLFKIANKDTSQNYVCTVCNFESKDPLWRCPECKNIDSFSFSK